MVKTELEEAGLDAENMAETTSTLQAKLLALSHGRVDVMKNADEFKSTTEILRELADAWEHMTDVEQAAAIELVAGKRQANIVASLMTNFDTVEKAIETSMNSEGSAVKENEKYLESIAGKTEALTRSMEEFWNRLVNSNVIKFFIDLTRQVVNTANTIGPFTSSVIALVAALSSIKNINILTVFKDMFVHFKTLGASINNLSLLSKSITQAANISSVGQLGVLDVTQVTRYAQAVAGLTPNLQASRLAMAGLNQEQIRQVLTANNVTQAQMQQAMSQREVTKSIIENGAAENSVLITDAEVTAFKKDQTISNYLLTMSNQQLTASMVMQAVFSGRLTAQQAQQIITTLGLTSAEGGLAVATNSASVAARGLGASLKALFLSNPIGWILLLGSTVAMLVSHFTQAKQSSKDLIQSVENVKTEYKQAVDEIQNSVKTVNDLEDEFTKLSKGVNAAGENISLSSDDYKRYQEIVKTLIDLNPSLVSGYNSQGQAIINNNKAIQETIDLLRQKQQLEAQEASKYENNENSRKSVEAQVDEATHDFNVNSGRVATLDAGVQKATNAIYDTIMSDLRYDSDDWENAVQIETEYVNEFLRMIGSQAKVEIDENGVPIEYIRETLSTEIEANYDQIIEDLRSGNSRLAAFFGQESADELVMLQTDYESKLNNYNATIENARKQLNEQILTNLKASNAYWNLEDETTRSYVESYIDGLDVNEDNFYGKLDEAKQFISWISIKQEEVSKLIGKAAYAKSGTDENGAEVTFAEYQKNIQAIVDDINNSNYSDTQKNWLLQMLGLDDTTLLRINQEMDHVNGLIQQESEKVKKEKADQLTGATQAVKNAQAELKEAEREYNETLNEAEAAGYTNFSVTKFGNIDTDKVKAVTWDETTFKEAQSQLESWGYTLDQLQGTTSTVLGMWDGFDLGDTTLDIAFTPMLQTDEGVKILSPDEIDSYIGGLIDELKSSGKDWTNEDLIALDARGVVKDGVLIKNIIADVGETASHTSEVMHFAGQNGAVALARRNADESRKAVEEAQNQLKQVQSDSYDEIEAWKQSLTASDLELLYTISADANSMTLDQMQDKLLELKQNSGAHITPAITYDKLTESLDGYNNAVSQTNAILSDNTKVTSEYKDSLIALGIEESTLKEYFYEDNELVVKNAEGLNKLVKATKNSVLTNTKLAKSQAMLKYNQLQQRAHALASKYRNLTAAEKEELNTLYQEMSMLQKSIAKYSLLEHTLLGATTAYEKFAEAQDIDASNTYTEQAQNMVSALSEAFYTAKLGTETAQAAIEGLIPESVFADADTLDDKMQKIYDYFTGGELTKYFSIEFDDDGKVSEVEMKLENVENFFNEGKDRGIFTGTWDEFDLDPAIKSLDELADKMGVTKEVAFSVLSEMEKYDINWLGGDNTTLLDKLTSDSLEMRLYATSSAMAELDQQYTSGSIDAVQYRQKLAELEQQMSSLGTEAVTKANNYLDLEKRVTEVSNELTEAQKALADAQAKVDKNKDDKSAQKALEEQTELVVELAQKYQDLKKEQDALGTISELEMATALQALGVDINNINESLKETKNKMLEIFNDNMFDSGSLQIFKDHLRETYDIVRAIDENGNATISITNITSEEDRAELAKIGELQEDGSINITTMYQGLTPEQREQIDQLAALQDKQELINFYMEMNGQDPVQSALDGIKEVLENIYKQLSEGATLSVSTATAQNNINRLKYTLDTFKNTNYDKTINVRTYEYTYQATKGTQTQGPTKWQGNAYAQGKFGAPASEQSLVGELGPEMVVRGNQWFTVGDNGAEFFDVKKDDIIFNHKQTEQILKNGHINSRGQAYAQGTAYAGINTWTGGYNGGSNSNNNNSNTSDNLSDAASDLSDAAEEFKEVFDWFEVKLEEINELLELMGAQLENIVDISGKNQKINSIIEENKYKVSILAQGLKLYEDYANKLLAEVPEQYRDAAQNGKIAIEEFTGEVGEKTLEAINNYREWAKKVADVQQQMEELVQTIADLAKQKFDVIDDGYGNELSLVADQIDRIKDAISLTEKKGYISSTRYYKEMGILTQQRLDSLKEEHDLLKESLDESVLAGDIQKYSEQWYDMVSAINDVDDEINDCLSDLEEFQNAINDIYWSNFDQLITNLDYFKTETQNLIDLMEKSGDIVKDLSKEKDFWSAKEVEWTSEGLASLGLYAQQMEIAEYKTKQYENAIKSLSQDYEDGKYSVNEYQEKLSELKDAQYESIQNYYEAQDAIVSLNKTRVEAIKTGINKEIEAYEKLIKKKKEELTTEKNLYDFQKNVSKQQKSISEIERKISALSGDYSTSAVAQRKKLEAELLEAKKELEETYYDRSISDQQDALDNELNNFKEQKEEEIKKWEQYLADVETVITDSLNLVQENALNIYETLIGTSDEYGLTLSDSVVTPWKNGTTAISNYQETFNTASSETCKSLDEIRDKWQSVIDLMVLAGDSDIINIKTDNESHMTPQVKTESPTSTSNSSSNTTTNNTQAQSSTPTSENETSQPSTEVGSTVVVKTTATQFATGQKMAPFVPGGSYTVYKEDGDKLLIGKDGVYTGWVYKKDIQGYAKGTTGLKKNQLAIVDELGEELVLHAGENGKLQFLTKGTSVIPADITENLMTLGKIDPQEMLNRNRASIGVDPSIVNNNVTIDISYGDILHIDNFDGTNPDEIAKIVSKEFDAQQKKLNDSLRRFAR